MAIDLGAHFFPLVYWKELCKALSIPIDFLRHPKFHDLEFRIKMMDRQKEDLQLLTWGLSIDAFNIKDPLKFAKIGNDAYAVICNKYPSRFLAAANVPLQEIGSAIDELDRCVRDLGFRAVNMVTNLLGRPIDSKELMPFYQRVTQLDIPIILHPALGNYYEWWKEYTLDMLWGWPFDTTMAMSRLVFGGVLEKFSNLKIVTHHAGAMVPTFIDRINGFYEQTLDGSQPVTPGIWPVKIGKNPLEYFRLFYNDTALCGYTPGLMLAYKFFGPQKLVFGSDYPFGPENGERYVKETLRSIQQMEITQEEKETILERNARSLLKIS